MRPKIVVLVLIATIGVVALAAVLRGVMGGRGQEEAAAPEPPPSEAASPASNSPQVSANSSNSAAIIEQLRAAELAKELDQIRELQADGAVNPLAAGLLVGKITHKEPEVRKAAKEALVQLGDTNAIPGMEQAAGLIEDPREKLALMEAIDYLKLPDAMAIDPSMVRTNQDATASVSSRPLKITPNDPRIQPRKNRARRTPAPAAGAAVKPGASTGAASSPTQPQTQPASAVPGTTPPPDTAPPTDAAPPQ
jgi:hypothetical protein